MLKPASPWTTAERLGTGPRNGSTELLIVGPVGTLPMHCAKEIHRKTGGGNFERVTCTADSVALRTQVFGVTLSDDTEYSLFGQEPPNSAIYRAAGGTLFLEGLDRCNPHDAEWMRLLVARQPVKVDGNAAELDANTSVIASITYDWADRVEYAVPQWIRALFGEQVAVLEPLQNRPVDILRAMEWFSWEVAPEADSFGALWSNEAKKLFFGRQWAGGHEELRQVVRSVIAATAGELIGFDICQRILAGYESPGMKPIDNHRWQECYNSARGLLYIGRQISANEIYQWVEQFSRVASNRRLDPWSAGLRIVRGISSKYYYSSDRVHALIRTAYSSLCAELAEQGYLSSSFLANGDALPPGLQALLVNPLGPIKSAASVLPHMAHLVGSGRLQKVVPVKDVASRLTEDERIQVVLFCDDFGGTGQQISKQIVDALASDQQLRSVCESRSRAGRPVALGVVLGIGFAAALTRIQMSGPEWLPVFAHAGERLDESDRAFSSDSTIFPEPELRSWAKGLVVDQVGACLSPSWPGGFGDLQSLVVTADNAPNDTLPAIWRSGAVQGMPWKALFERVSSPSG